MIKITHAAVIAICASASVKHKIGVADADHACGCDIKEDYTDLVSCVSGRIILNQCPMAAIYDAMTITDKSDLCEEAAATGAKDFYILTEMPLGFQFESLQLPLAGKGCKAEMFEAGLIAGAPDGSTGCSAYGFEPQWSAKDPELTLDEKESTGLVEVAEEDKKENYIEVEALHVRFSKECVLPSQGSFDGGAYVVMSSLQYSKASGAAASAGIALTGLVLAFI